MEGYVALRDADDGSGKSMEEIFAYGRENYGMDLFERPRRVIGLVRDLASGRDEEVRCLSRAYALLIPQRISSGEVSDGAGAAACVKELCACGIRQDCAVRIVGLFGEIYGRDLLAGMDEGREKAPRRGVRNSFQDAAIDDGGIE